MNCSICNSPTNPVFKATILFKYHIAYFSCSHCGFIQTEEPYWLPEAYDHTLNDEDTSVMQRNLQFSEIVPSVIFTLFKRNGKFLDFGGGHGVFTRLMRDRGFDFYWNDPHGRNLFARVFEYVPNRDQIELITSIECFEHFARPRKELETLLGISSNIFFVTQLLPTPIPGPEAWDYYGLTHGQHIAFFSKQTLHYLADQYALQLHTNGTNIHLFTKRKFSRFRFSRALHPGPLLKMRIRMVMKSKYQADYNHVVRMKSNTEPRA